MARRELQRKMNLLGDRDPDAGSTSKATPAIPMVSAFPPLAYFTRSKMSDPEDDCSDLRRLRRFADHYRSLAVGFSAWRTQFEPKRDDWKVRSVVQRLLRTRQDCEIGLRRKFADCADPYAFLSSNPVRKTCASLRQGDRAIIRDGSAIAILLVKTDGTSPILTAMGLQWLEFEFRSVLPGASIAGTPFWWLDGWLQNTMLRLVGSFDEFDEPDRHHSGLLPIDAAITLKRRYRAAASAFGDADCPSDPIAAKRRAGEVARALRHPGFSQSNEGRRKEDRPS